MQASSGSSVVELLTYYWVEGKEHTLTVELKAQNFEANIKLHCKILH